MPDCKCFPLAHGKEFPFHYVKPNETIFMVDFCLPWDDMIKLKYSCKNLIWIDHHISGIEDYNKHLRMTGNEFRGKRELGKAAIELTWEWFAEESIHVRDMPLAVKLLGRYDVWDLEYDPRVMTFQYGLRLWAMKPDDETWAELFDDEGDMINEIAKKGAAVLEYQRQDFTRYMKNYYFEAKFDGLKAICVNRTNTSSHIFDGFYDQKIHDIMICFVFNGNQWRITLYTEKEGISCAKIARRFGGGGHAKAAGFVTENFLEMLEY